VDREQTQEQPMLSQAQTNMLTLLDQVAARILDGNIKALVVTSVMEDGLGRNAYIITPNTAVTLVGSLEIAKQEIVQGVMQEARQVLGVPQTPHGGKTDDKTADSVLPHGVIATDQGEVPTSIPRRGVE